MSSGKNEKTGSSKAARKRKDRAAEVANTFEWLITAFVLAFVFRAFVMEAFRIPTGSMANTLKGAHFRLRCPQCGYRYDHGFPTRNDDFIPPGNVPLPVTRCPSCGYYPSRLLCRTCGRIYDSDSIAKKNKLHQNINSSSNTAAMPYRCPRCNGYLLLTDKEMPVANGDRILVLKCIYQFFQPKRWDIIVFKNPLDPTENYIKRLIGLPEEKVEIIDGDIYINDRISRKPPKVQDNLWMPVYDNDYQPVWPREGSFNGHRWRQPFKNDRGSKWIVGDKANPTLFRLDSPADQINTLVYNTSNDKDFKATYAYNEVDVRREKELPFCSDLRVRFYADSSNRQGRIGIELSKYGTHYRAWVDLTGEMVITKDEQGKKTIELKRKPIHLPAAGKPTLVRFANVDHQLIFEFGSEKLTYDLGSGPGDAGPIKTDAEPQVKIFGAGKLTLSHIVIFRDIHYTRYRLGDNHTPGRATQDHPFPLSEDEFFVLGDNSPNSEDGRWWNRPGMANNGLSYREGIVPRDYLVGKALFVYWPSGFEFPWPKSLKTFLSKNSRYNRLSTVAHWIVSLRWIPNVGQMRFIYGGSSKKSARICNGE